MVYNISPPSVNSSVKEYIKQEARKISLKEAIVFFNRFDNKIIHTNHRSIAFDRNGKWIDFLWCKRHKPFIIRVYRTKNNILVFEKRNFIINILFFVITALYSIVE